MPIKEREREYLRRFAAAMPELGVGEAEDSEEPDFLVQRGGASLGIEVTRYAPVPRTTGFIPEEQTSLRNKVMRLARELYDADAGHPLQVSAYFNDHRLLKAGHIAVIARELADLLLRTSVDVAVWDRVPFHAADKSPFLREIGHITAFRVPTPDHGVWYAGQGAWVREASSADFAGVLAAKEKRLPAYRSRCAEIWLLIVFETLAGGEYVELPSDHASSVETGFDRVFALERATSRCIELTVRGAA